MRAWKINGPFLSLAHDINITFQRTPQTTASNCLGEPSSFGALPLAEMDDAVVVPVASEEAFWLGFEVPPSHPPLCLRISVFNKITVDATTGEPWCDALQSVPQNYLVCPPQPAINGVRDKTGIFKCFAREVHNPECYYACRSLTIHAIKLTMSAHWQIRTRSAALEPQRNEMAVGPISHVNATRGGSVIHADPIGLSAWDIGNATLTHVILASFDFFKGITGTLPRSLMETEGYKPRLLP